ncbi:MAG TPA: hypothetical protein PK307_01160 [Spirochaetota bacterium]|nr:hypothetical protein [Spirochaetota bacterium]HOD15495.1 hypothetical protein [Spirochaetota bacterium]HPN14449.1 hypothetical protein [Spirochaetota bacterium]HQL80780.1 hypothetical protein [Spirochaetota bacterium]
MKPYRTRDAAVMRIAGLAAMALSAAVPCACSPCADLRIESNIPSTVLDRGGRTVCASTPCVMRVSRETCRFYNSSTGYIILDAASRGGVTLRSMPIVACDVTDGMRLSFMFPSVKGRDCGVTLYGGERGEYGIPCADALVR